MLEASINELSQKYEAAVEDLTLSFKSIDTQASADMLNMIAAMRQNIQIMLRLSSDIEHNKALDISDDEVTKIGDYALNLLDEISLAAGSKGLQQQMLDLQRLSLPVANWLKRHGGKIVKLDIVVNAIASYANTLQDIDQIKILCKQITVVVDITDEVIKQDLEATNAMRPWRILNLNWGIVATRTHDTDIMMQVFDQLIKNIPADAQQFFNEGMQQMIAVGYPDHVRKLMEKYAAGFGGEGVLH